MKPGRIATEKFLNPANHVGPFMKYKLILKNRSFSRGDYKQLKHGGGP
jgi:hypothetical protein